MPFRKLSTPAGLAGALCWPPGAHEFACRPMLSRNDEVRAADVLQEASRLLRAPVKLGNARRAGPSRQTKENRIKTMDERAEELLPLGSMGKLATSEPLGSGKK